MPSKVLLRKNLTQEEVVSTFRTVWLEENYNFLEDDLVKLANAFIDAYIKKASEEAKPRAIKETN